MSVSEKVQHSQAMNIITWTTNHSTYQPVRS